MPEQVTTTEQSVPMLQPDLGSSDLIKYMIMNDDDAERLFILLSGKQWDSNKKAYIQVHRALISDEGIAEMLTIYQTNTGKNPTMTYFKTEERVMKLISNIWQEVLDKLFIKGDEWQVEKQNRSTIIMMIVHSSYFTLMKGLEGNYQGMIRPTIRRTENINTGKQGGDGGIKDFLNYLSPIK